MHTTVIKMNHIHSMLKDQARPAAATKFEIRNSKFETISNDKNSKLHDIRKSYLINALRLRILKNKHKKQEVDG